MSERGREQGIERLRGLATRVDERLEQDGGHRLDLGVGDDL